jgi:hypothetical protein
VVLAALDQDKHTLAQLDLPAVDHRDTLAADDEEPLVSSTVVVVRPAFGPAGGKRHLGRLRMLVAKDDAETAAELQMFVLHGSKC